MLFNFSQNLLIKAWRSQKNNSLLTAGRSREVDEGDGPRFRR